MIAVTGSSGKTGKAVISALVDRGAPVRAVVHREQKRSELGALGVAEVRIGDLTDPDSLVGALAGSQVAYHICPNMRPDEVEIGERVIEACRRVGVERLVYHSVLHPQIEAMPHHWKKLRVEESLIESGLAFTILQPAAYMQNVRAQWSSAAVRGLLEVPYAATTRLGMVDLRDVAGAAARVLTENGHAGAIYDLCGPQVMDQRQIAQVLSNRLRHSVAVAELDRTAWVEQARESGLSSYAVESLTAMFRHYEQHGFWGSPRMLESLLERPATRFEAVVERWPTHAE